MICCCKFSCEFRAFINCSSFKCSSQLIRNVLIKKFEQKGIPSGKVSIFIRIQYIHIAMSKFKVLHHNQKIMARLGINSHSLRSLTNEFFHSFSAFCITSITIIFTIISCIVFIYENITNYESVIDAAMCSFAGLQGCGMFISIGLNMKNVKALHLKLQEIIDNISDNDDNGIANMYWENEQKCQKFTKWFFYYVFAHQSIVMASLCYSFYCIFVGNRDTSTFVLAFNIVVPFDTRHLFGWYVQWLIQLSMSISYVLSVVSVTSYFVCCCLYVQAICDHFNLLINSIDQNGEPYDERIQKTEMIEAIEIHVKVFE